MAQYRDIDLPTGVPLRVNGDLMIPTSFNLSVGGNITLTGNLVLTGFVRKDTEIQFIKSADTTAQGIRVASIGVSNVYDATSLPPTNGIYSKGDIKTDGNFTFNADDKGISFSNGNGGRVYKKSGSGIKIQAHLDTVGVAITKADGTDMFVVKTDGTGMTYNGQTVYHAGNLTINDSAYVKNNVTGQSVETGFTMKGTANVGNNGNTGVLLIKDSNGNQVIKLDGVRAGAVPSTPNITMDGDGNATFKGIVNVANITTGSTDRVDKLNAQYLDGKSVSQLVGTESIYDIAGGGVYSGVDVIETAVPSASIRVSAGVVYTSSGRRFVFTGTEQRAIAAPSATFYRYDIAFIHGASSGTSEGTIGIVSGSATSNTQAGATAPTRAAAGAAPTTFQYPYDAVVLARISVKPIGQYSGGNATILNADIDKTFKELRPVIFNGLDFKIGSYSTVNLQVTGAITEGGKLLTDKYPQLGAAGALINNTFYGKQTIAWGGPFYNELNNAPFRIVDGAYSLGISRNEIKTSGIGLYINSIGTGTAVFIQDNVSVDPSGYLKAVKNATNATFAVGETKKRWTHNYGGSTYSVVFSCSSFQRHVRWTNKTPTYVEFELDGPATEELYIDIILIGRDAVWGIT